MLSKQYEHMKVLGQGSFGKVYLIRNKDTQQLFVDKVIPLCDVTQCQIHRIIKQAQILKNLQHPNIIKFKDYTIQENNLHILMQYAPNGDLASIIQDCQKKNKTIPEQQILDWTIQLLEGIDYIHNNRIIHRDLKSQNVFVGKGGVLKIGDFGVSTVLGTASEKAKTVIGTIYNISPQILNNEPYTQKADIWSLGTIIYELCTLRRPFEGYSMAALVLKITVGDYAPIGKNTSKGMKQIIEVMLQLDPQRRPWAEELLENKILLGRKIELERLVLKEKQLRLEQIKRMQIDEKIRVKIQLRKDQSALQTLRKTHIHQVTTIQIENRSQRLNDRVQENEIGDQTVSEVASEIQSSGMINIKKSQQRKQQEQTFKCDDIVTKLKQSKLAQNQQKQDDPTLKHQRKSLSNHKDKELKSYVSVPVPTTDRGTKKYNIPLHVSLQSLNFSPVRENNAENRSMNDASTLEIFRVKLQNKLGIQRFKQYYKIIENKEDMYQSVLKLSRQERDMFDENYKEVENLIKMERKCSG